ncbi:uncharacterized protein LOC129347328 [Amphiprion ocellaris]|uniref:uncharacterized protein LOC129347328 n=1 Tax=Amphiprion ocellaris TaxID=80972 RepID=UPI0024115D88|nr:uncharacterized protein LOC129347328 [Amphiprion ocellaris]XP_054860078.1 uncharacterized protein LOC129347328 [Amphiprion ocellaris]XP_054860080.1 uncharacterized protein LOC129347328 [Amphiprion ocellaris]XP_054860085.1 uncharacterized protein LOC129347328 [Amphiprion ocellaris]XP_054860088.1 uncharacterized protein LOC129347328 [Amphiprion ocellaris]XP_054860091.1 uncharacterized protein LOC129347328 [Amphiprion ocellaris]XP_054860098.1 uncharacterized protein LOC129347328 [Amphiprion o
MNQRPKPSYSSFENLNLSLSHPDLKAQKPVLFVVVCRPPAPYSEFLSQFSDFLSDLVLSSDKVIIVGDFNIHVDVDSDSLTTAFNSILDSIGFSQHVHKPTHSFNHTLDLVLTYGIEIKQLTVFPRNPLLFDHFMITFKVTTIGCIGVKNKHRYSRCHSDNLVTKFKELIPSLFSSAPLTDIMEGKYYNFTPTEVDYIVNNAAASVRTTLDSVAPVKKKVISQRGPAPWYNSQLQNLKQASRKLERKWYSTNLEEVYVAWKNSLVIYKKALHNARTTYYSSLIEENKNNPRFLFSTVARLTKSQSSVEPCIPLALSSNDFMSFFTNKIITIREKINLALPTNVTDVSSSTNTLELAVRPDGYLEFFTPIHLFELISIVSTSKPSTCLLDPIPLASSTTVRNLGVIFDQDMSFNSHIKQICRTSFFHLRNIVKIRNILSQSDAEKLVHAFVTSRLDYGNSLLSGCPNSSLKHLELIQNAAARVLTGVSKRDHSSPILVSLQWLPVKSRIEFKILLLTYKALNNQSLSYLKDLIVPYYPSRTLRSQTAGLLVVPRISKSRMGSRAFSYQVPLLWNQLPVWVREADTLSTFKTRLKTFLFDKAYS